MTDQLTANLPEGADRLDRRTFPPGRAGWLGRGLLIGIAALGAAALFVVARPSDGPALAVVLFVGILVLVAVGTLLYRRPWLVPWLAIVTFSTSAELRLRLSPQLGVVKDVYVALLVGILAVHLFRQPAVLRRLRPVGAPLAAVAVVLVLYVVNPAGGHGGPWLFGTRLLLEVSALFMVGILWPQARRTAEHLVRAMTFLLPLEAVFAWIQQWAGADSLVYQWGYQYGAQIRTTTGGGLRTSGTFEDPFQLAALAVLGLALAAFVATRRQRLILVISAVAVLGATSVRTAIIETGILLVLLAVRHGWWRQIAALVGVAAVAGIFFLATTTSAVRPGAPQEALLLTLNGRSSAWSQAIQGWESLVAGNGVGTRGIGSTRQDTLISTPPAYDPNSAPPALFAGSSAFLDSAYAQVQSDVGIVGTVGFIAGILGLAVVLARRCSSPNGSGPAWAALAVIAVSAVDWVGRSSLASYTTGFITLYILGVLLARTFTPGGSS